MEKAKRKTLLRRVFNRVLGITARWVPGSTSLRPMLHRWRGVKVHRRVFIGDDVYLENEYPEQVEIEEGVQVCLRSVIIAHSHGTGRVLLKKNAFVGAGVYIVAAPGHVLTVGEGAVITVGAVVTSDVAPGVLFGMDKAKPIANATIPMSMDVSYREFLGGLRPLNSPARRPVSPSASDNSSQKIPPPMPVPAPNGVSVSTSNPC